MAGNDLGIYDRWDWWDDSDRQKRLLHALVPPRMAWFGPLVGGWGGQRVLDAGCGGGFFAEALADAGAHVTGVDPSAPALEKARAHAAHTGLTIGYHGATADHLPFETASFDVVACVDVLEHVPDVEGAVAELSRVLRPGGWFLYETINRTTLSWWVAIKAGEDWLGLVPTGTHDWEKFLSPARMAAAVGANGLVDHRTVGVGPVGIDRRFDLVFGRLPTRAVQYLGAARKPA